MEPIRIRLLTVSQVADRLQVNRQTVWNWIQTGRLEALDIGTQGRPQYRISEAAVASVCRKACV